MIEQQGKVVANEGERISVRLGATSGCSACDAGKGCGAGVFGRLLQRRPVVMEFVNTVGASPGQAVVVGLPETLFLSLVSRLYLYPLLGGLAGAIAGHVVAGYLGGGEAASDLSALICGLAGAILVLRSRRRTAVFPRQPVVQLLRTVDCNEPD